MLRPSTARRHSGAASGSKAAAKGTAAAPTRRRDQQTAVADEEDGGEEDEVPTQGLDGKAALPSPTSAARRKSGETGQLPRHVLPSPSALCAPGRPTIALATHMPISRRLLPLSPPAAGRCFEGCVLLVTGFGDQPEEKRAVVKALREGGAAIADAVPEPPQASGRWAWVALHVAGGREWRSPAARGPPCGPI